MTTFDERERAYEKKFAHDEELKFKAEARANKMLGLWAADIEGKSGPEAEEYAREVMASDLEEPGAEDVIRKVCADLGSSGFGDQVREKRQQFLELAMKELSRQD
ncbi:DUF1476 domain-containing protein [Candidatus Halocynthiibacter alkanivorans]|uniref:DUF1476 domain-containing protein n=1 Tax=Candidatus Halocynthiibacter alkanivorans TaxID=2267619 RepID=UPI000DF3E627|nr:DUF1476 domain-containing protein [Candidatus Halocynthiibacter alkanivorans]